MFPGDTEHVSNIHPTPSAQEAPMLCTIVVTRTVRLRGRQIEAGTRHQAQRLNASGGDGWSIAHPSGIEGARAFVPQRNAAEVAS